MTFFRRTFPADGPAMPVISSQPIPPVISANAMRHGRRININLADSYCMFKSENPIANRENKQLLIFPCRHRSMGQQDASYGCTCPCKAQRRDGKDRIRQRRAEVCQDEGRRKLARYLRVSWSERGRKLLSLTLFSVAPVSTRKGATDFVQRQGDVSLRSSTLDLLRHSPQIQPCKYLFQVIHPTGF